MNVHDEVCALFSAAERSGYEDAATRAAALQAVEADAVKSFPGAKTPVEALQMALRHERDRLAAARARVTKRLMVR